MGNKIVALDVPKDNPRQQFDVMPFTIQEQHMGIVLRRIKEGRGDVLIMHKFKYTHSRWWNSLKFWWIRVKVKMDLI